MKIPACCLVMIMGLSACDSETVKRSGDCVHTAVVEDHTGLDGCGYLFKLDNGEYLQPVWRWGLICGTPPLPDYITEDPLWNFQYADGRRVKIGFEYTNEYATTCMKGRTVIITCLEEVDGPAPSEE